MMTANQNPTAVSEELAKLAQLAREQAQAVLQKLPLLGPVVWLMMQQGPTRHTFVADLEWRVLPALVLDQAKLYMKDSLPLAFATWARLSHAAAERFRQPPYRLAPADWKSGDQIWLVDVIAPFGGANDVLKDLRENVFPASRLHQLAPLPPSEAKVIEWPPVRGGI
jgi:cytolysin-activating lysine-acyltransferase